MFRDNIWVTHKPGIWETGCSSPNYSIGGNCTEDLAAWRGGSWRCTPWTSLTSLASDWVCQLVTLNLYLYRWQIKVTGAGVHIMGTNADSNNWAEGVWQDWGSSFFSGWSLNFHRWNYHTACLFGFDTLRAWGFFYLISLCLLQLFVGLFLLTALYSW